MQLPFRTPHDGALTAFQPPSEAEAPTTNDLEALYLGARATAAGFLAVGAVVSLETPVNGVGSGLLGFGTAMAVVALHARQVAKVEKKID